MDQLPSGWQAVIYAALAEDLGEGGDITTLAVVPEAATLKAGMVFREAGVVCGLALAEGVFSALASGLVTVAWTLADGDRVSAGGQVGVIEGPASVVLAGERTALNLVSHLSGIATRTAAFVEAVQGTSAEIYDTRKTTPGLRMLDKHAVLVGGGCNHRYGLYDQVLIKDNHLALAGGVAEAVRRARARWGDRYAIEVEAESVTDAVAAARAGADIVMLDNMPRADMAAATKAVTGRCVVEASGGITLETVRAVAELGVDRIAVGALTDGPGIDVGLDTA